MKFIIPFISLILLISNLNAYSVPKRVINLEIDASKNIAHIEENVQYSIINLQPIASNELNNKIRIEKVLPNSGEKLSKFSVGLVGNEKSKIESSKVEVDKSKKTIHIFTEVHVPKDQNLFTLNYQYEQHNAFEDNKSMRVSNFEVSNSRNSDVPISFNYYITRLGKELNVNDINLPQAKFEFEYSKNKLKHIEVKNEDTNNKLKENPLDKVYKISFDSLISKNSVKMINLGIKNHEIPIANRAEKTIYTPNNGNNNTNPYPSPKKIVLVKKPPTTVIIRPKTGYNSGGVVVVRQTNPEVTIIEAVVGVVILIILIVIIIICCPGVKSNDTVYIDQPSSNVDVVIIEQPQTTYVIEQPQPTYVVQDETVVVIDNR